MIGFLILFLLIAWLVGKVGLVVEAFREDLLWGLGVLFLPIVPWIFVGRHWERARNPFLLQVAAFSGLFVVLTFFSRGGRRHSPPPQPRPVAAAAAGPEEAVDPDVALAEARARVARFAATEAPAARPREAQEEEQRGPTEEEIVRSVEQLYERAASGEAAERAAAVKEWRQRGLDRLPNARLKMVRALAKRATQPEAEVLVASLQARPPGLGEALLCLEVDGCPPPIRQALLLDLRDHPKEEHADRLERVLSRLRDTDDALMDEVLIRHRRVRKGASQRLVAARGLAWVRSDEGQALLGALVALDLSDLRTLLGSRSANERATGCELLVLAGDREVRQAVKLALPLLGDEAPEVRQSSAWALSQLGEPGASWPLARTYLRERDRAVREALQGALRALPAAKTLGYLTRLHQQASVADRLAAQYAARALDTPPALRILTAGLTDADRRVRLDALRGLQRKAGDAACRPVILEAQATIRDLARAQGDAEVQELAFELDRTLLLGGK